MLRAGRSIHCPRVALGCHPTLLVVLRGFGSYSGNPRLTLLHGALQHREALTHCKLPDDFAVLYVQVVGHCNRRRAGVELVVLFCNYGASLVSDSEPASCPVSASLPSNTKGGLESLLSWAFDEFQNLLHLQSPDWLLPFILELRQHGNHLLAGVKWLLHLLQKGSALIANHADPSVCRVGQGLPLDARESQLLINARPL
mmetsp:Transcript_112055/g.327735  ORF Transcript_112055/g.327735 Transcript_112055/m.327735 type:complete len:200 (-) Transcript_112055:5161-5760(-)